MKPDEKNFIGYFEQNQKDFRNKLVRSDAKQKCIFETQMKSDVKSYALEQTDREKRLTNLVQKSGIYGERFTKDHEKRMSGGNGHLIQNGSDNLNLAMQQRNDVARAEQERLNVEKRKISQHMNRIREEDEIRQNQKKAQGEHMRMYYNMQTITKERNAQITEKRMGEHVLEHNKPAVQHLLK